MDGFLIVLGLLAAAGGLLSLSEATTGVGIIGFGCFLGVLARIAQADKQHKASIEKLGKLISLQKGTGTILEQPPATTNPKGDVAKSE